MLSVRAVCHAADTLSALSTPEDATQPPRWSSSSLLLTADAARDRRSALVSSRKLATPVAAMPSAPMLRMVIAASASIRLVPCRRRRGCLVTATTSVRSGRAKESALRLNRISRSALVESNLRRVSCGRSGVESAQYRSTHERPALSIGVATAFITWLVAQPE